ncbi:hypothetical protein [Chondromyces crocatus]|uniref:Uncharacterized protein n=1 Tax=Chondromyces crocatus TaxID=52 RepID=A0A0K1ECX2_CHOCO|nr:hypothetical protein [Chondromyces crocatus]AKT38689.1 uncharacterized protein CMC5_028370 [Chondromyces crocatus]
MESTSCTWLVDLFCNQPALASEMAKLVLASLALDHEGVPSAPRPGSPWASPEIVVLSAILHGKGEHGEAIGKAFLAVAAGLDEKRRAVYTDLVLVSLNDTARQKLEALMTHAYEVQCALARSHGGKGQPEPGQKRSSRCSKRVG